MQPLILVGGILAQEMDSQAFAVRRYALSKQIMGASQNEEDCLDEASIPPIQLHHIGFKTARLLEMREFYRTFLGVHPVLEVEGIAGFYTFDLAHHRLVLFHDPTCTEQVSTCAGMHHVAFLYSLDDLMRVYQRLKHKGVNLRIKWADC